MFAADHHIIYVNIIISENLVTICILSTLKLTAGIIRSTYVPRTLRIRFVLRKSLYTLYTLRILEVIQYVSVCEYHCVCIFLRSRSDHYDDL